MEVKITSTVIQEAKISLQQSEIRMLHYILELFIRENIHKNLEGPRIKFASELRNNIR